MVFTEAGQGSVLDQDDLVPQIQVLTDFFISMFCCFIRVGTFPDLRLDLFEGRLQTMLTLFQSGIAGGRSLGKGSSEISVGMFCLA